MTLTDIGIANHDKGTRKRIVLFNTTHTHEWNECVQAGDT